jgi:RHS repeat-associated protein
VDRVTDPNNRLTQYTYDDANRRTQVINALNQVTTFGYDTLGNLVSLKDARNNTTRYEYDASNRRIRTIYPDQTTDLVGYDAGGRVTSRTDQNGKVTAYGYDKLSRLTQVTDPLQQVTKFEYDELGNRVAQIDAKNRRTKYEYDKLGRRTKRVLPLGQTESYGYDLAGNLTTKTDFNGKTTTYQYDFLNRLLSKTPDASFAAPTVVYTYNALGQRKTMSDASGLTTYNYDSRDRLNSKVTPQGTLTYTYDVASNVRTINSSNANGVSITYTYDELNRLASVSDVTAGSAAYAYDEVGNLLSVLNSNGVRSAYTYNSLNRLTNLASCGTGVLACDSGSANIANYGYTLDNVGNRLSVAELGGRAVSYAYDGLYRLARESISGDPDGQNGSADYSYDEVGNRLSLISSIPNLASANLGTLNYDNNDRLISSSSEQYDANGDTTSYGGVTNVYDFENRLIQRGNVSIVYDGDGNRVAETVGGVTTRYLVDDLNPTGYTQVVEELQGGVVVRKYAYGLQRISQRQLIGGVWTTHFYQYDGHGSVRQLTDSAGSVTDTYTYDAFGNLLARTGATPNNMLFAGEEFDPALGLYYNRARYFDPRNGRFWSMDLFEGYGTDPSSLHKYTYVGNNPVNLSDPTGFAADLGSTLQSIGIATTIAALSGAIIEGIRAGPEDACREH